MKAILAYTLLACATLTLARPSNVLVDRAAASFDATAEENCEMEWVTVTGEPPSTTQASGTGNGTVSVDADIDSAAAAAGIHGLHTDVVAKIDNSQVKLPGNQAPIPLTSDYTHAPEANTAVPADAAIYRPKSDSFDCLDFSRWRDAIRQKAPASKYIKIAAGAYRLAPGPVMPAGTDANTVEGENIVMYLMKGGWTLDLRGVTFYVDISAANANQRPGVIVYVLQSDNLLILGGTIWVDFGELYSQARVTALSPTGRATFTLDKGYNATVWKDAGPRNQNCLLPSDDGKHYTYPGCNFWKVGGYDFTRLDGEGVWEADVFGQEAKLQLGSVVTMMNGLNGLNSLFTLSNEDNSGLVVNGMTTNGGFMSIGVNPGQTPPRFVNCYSVNPPARPGFAPRATGPLISWGNVNRGFIYDAPGAPKATFDRSFYQFSGAAADLWNANEANASPA